MGPKMQFQRWYGCDEVNRVSVGNAVAMELGTHVRVGEGVLDPIDRDALVIDQKAALFGIYMLRSVSRWTDQRNGYLPHIVAVSYVWGLPVNPAEQYPDLMDFERRLALRAQ
jgi:hypothetical protein